MLLAATTAPAAAVPDPAQSSVDPCLAVCPSGDISFEVVVRDPLGIPIPGSTVVIDACDCPDLRVCEFPGSRPPGTNQECQLSVVTGALGKATFMIQAGGTCAAGSARILADGVQLATRGVASPDQDGNLLVDVADDAILAGKLGGPYDVTADLDCDAAMSPFDAAVLTAHLGHACDVPTPNRKRSWGELKTIYR
jgi:hypothetical protein